MAGGTGNIHTVKSLKQWMCFWCSKNAYKTTLLKDKIGDVTEWQHINGLAFVDFQAMAIKRNNVRTLILTSSWFSAERDTDARLSETKCLTLNVKHFQLFPVFL